MEVATDLEAARRKDRQDDLAGRAGVRRRLEHHQVAGPQALGDSFDGVDEDRDVGLALLRERCGQGDDDRVGVAKRVVVGGRRDAALCHERAELGRRHVLDVALAAVDAGDDVLDHVHQQHALPGLREQAG